MSKTEQILQMYQNGVPVKEIASKLDVSVIWVFKVVRKAGLTNRRDKSRVRRLQHIKHIHEMRSQGMDFESIANELNLAKSTVMWYCYRK